MTTRAEPYHDLAAALWLAELLLGVLAGALVIIVSTVHDFDLWYDGTPVLYAVFSVCGLCMAIKIYICFRYELPDINKILISIEYSGWTAFFDGGTRDITNTSALTKPLSQSYQFRSWSMIAAIWTCSLTTLLTSLIVTPPRLIFLA